MLERKFGWLRDLPDHRDFKLLLAPYPGPLPSSVDLRSGMPQVYDQGQLGSCTANAAGAAYQYMRGVEKKDIFMPSRLFIYYNSRKTDGTIKYDAGSTIRTSMKAIGQFGVPHEDAWPYNIDKFTKKPRRAAFKDGRKNLALQYLTVHQDLTSLKTSLAQNFPIVFGFAVYESFQSATVATTGIVPMPAVNESCLGGHAVVLVGYNDEKSHFIVRNSWGTNWGDNGYFYMPYEYITNKHLSADFWTVRDV